MGPERLAVNNWSELLRSKKLRVTPQRLSILQTLEELERQDHHRHLTARDVCEAVQVSLPSLNVTTVYRTLEDLNAAGLVDLMATGKDQVRFSLRRNHQRHGHLVCKRCGQIETVELGLFHSFAHDLQHQTGFSLDVDHLTLSGLCKACS